MNRDDIIRMALKAEVKQTWVEDGGVMYWSDLHRFADVVAAAEREACIKILESYQIPVGNSPAGELACDWTYDALKRLRDEIRERGNVK